MLANYKKSRDAAWELLLRHRVKTLPVDLEEICRKENLSLFPYSENVENMETLGLTKHAEGNDAFCLSNGMIFYNDRQIEGRIRFSIAHEIGHLVLHTDKVTLYNREPAEIDDPKETEANMFAARLLAPAIVLERIGVRTPEEIAKLCHISHQAATWRFKRLQLLRKRDEIFRAERGYSCFGLSPLERKIEKQFGKYIIKNVKQLKNRN